MLASSTGDDGRREWPNFGQRCCPLYTQARHMWPAFFGSPSPIPHGTVRGRGRPYGARDVTNAVRGIRESSDAVTFEAVDAEGVERFSPASRGTAAAAL